VSATRAARLPPAAQRRPADRPRRAAQAPDATSPIAAALIAWHAQHGRHDLPWQRERSPYRVWVSEVMLQQTQVATVIGYYERFMQRFPDVAALAAAPLDEVLHAWSGLGYYSRARHLQRAAQRILAEYGGELPDDPGSLQRLPGIGRSTAAAIVALARDRRAAILDGNVRRVLSRYFGIAGAPEEPATLAQLWALAERCTPAAQVAVYTQAIMDFGATLCTRAAPLCLQCPLRQGCVAQRSGRVQVLPTPRRRSARPLRQIVMLLAVRADGGILLQRRPAPGVWGGLWAPPQFSDRHGAQQFCARELTGATLEPEPLPLLRHAFTHFDLAITPLRARCADAAPAVMEAPGVLWYNAREPARVGLPAPIAALLATLTAAAAP
jgi:A/G-specific adenine glycosylase